MSKDLGPVLQILSGELAGRTFQVDDSEFVIGRAPSCHLVIPKRYISREHARIVREGRGEFFIDSLSRKNPVHVADRPIREHTLADGDEFEVCGIRIRFKLAGKGRGRKKQGVRMGSDSHAASGGGGVRFGDDEETRDDVDADEVSGESDLRDGLRDRGRDEVSGESDLLDRDPPSDSGPVTDPIDAKRARQKHKQKKKKSADKKKSKQIVFEVDEDEETEDAFSGEGELEDDDDVNERTAELGTAVDPDDPDYDPFAEVDRKVKKEVKVADPQREKLLRLLMMVGAGGIVFAAAFLYVVTRPKPRVLVEHDVVTHLAPDEVKLIEFDWVEPPQNYRPGVANAELRPNPVRVSDPGVCDVEWAVPGLPRKALYLVRGKNVGSATFTIHFPSFNRDVRFRIEVEGDPIGEAKREAEKAELQKLSLQDLRKKITEYLDLGDALTSTRQQPGKEHHYFLAQEAYRSANLAADVLREVVAGEGRPLRQQDQVQIDKCAESLDRAEEDYQTESTRKIGFYKKALETEKDREIWFAKLKVALRAVGDEESYEFIRMRLVYEKAFKQVWRTP